MKFIKLAAFSLSFLIFPAGEILAAGSDVTVGGVKSFTVLILTVVALFALAWAAKKYGPFSRVKRTLGLDILGQVPVGSRAHIALVRVGKSILLLGVTQNQVCLIKDLEQGDFEKAIEDAQITGRGQ